MRDDTRRSGRAAMKASTAVKKEAKDKGCWRSFKPGERSTSINVRDFIVRNVTPYDGDEKFLVAASKRTKAVWENSSRTFRRSERKACLPSMQKVHRPSSRTRPATLSGTTKSLSACRPMSRSSASLCTALGRWPDGQVRAFLDLLRPPLGR